MFLEINNVSKLFGSKTILENISFRVERGEIVSLIGPSGVGKTTLLKIIAGIDNPSDGEIRYETSPSIDNPVILVFQDYVLFPNMTVFENVAFGLKARKIERGEIDRRVGDLLSYFGIRDKARSYPSRLSAGQMQRVAIARAMVVNPSILLLDEPFANLDKNLKLETAAFIRRTQKDFGTTTVSVTHDLEEAFAMSDRIGILLDGRLVQYDTTRKIYFNPATLQAARFLGPVNTIPGRLIPYFDGNGALPAHTSGQVYARAESIEIVKKDGGKGIVKDICFVGTMILYEVQMDDTAFKVYSLNSDLDVGDRVALKLTGYFT